MKKWKESLFPNQNYILLAGVPGIALVIILKLLSTVPEIHMAQVLPELDDRSKNQMVDAKEAHQTLFRPP